MNLTHWTTAPEKKTPHNTNVRLLYNKPEAQAIHIFLKPGEELKPHTTPVDVFFFILEGNPTILIGKEEQQIKEGTIVESPKNIPHCIYNKTNKNARVLVVKTPRQEIPSMIL